MLIDHTAYALFLHMGAIAPSAGGGYGLYFDANAIPWLYNAMRIVGRLAFPIFAFLITEGVNHTTNIKKYLLRLGIFALISEIPFHLLVHGSLPLWEWRTYFLSERNVFFTLFLGAAMLSGMKLVDEKAYRIPADILIILGCCLIACLIDSDYSAGGILIILTFYCFKNNRLALFISQLAIYGLFYGGLQTFAILSLIPIIQYNGQRGAYRPWMKWAFYAFYPLHLTLLGFISIYKGLH